ncbi:multinuclear nonheme iron-dependent oxidase [Streptomyces zagrosensis]|uniref:SCO6045-like C-terminal domain-containing protein n=1 Tax=Streptomyces zagrosensis TaxID=1042984 RepID=A0A7W9QBB0_9ACTN|nr:DUF692 family multinuclear iron-containing protein [Streptomyces zagrosensis]MBB5936072.1 hypothetical protein [Streptomyces zagrosensis]
MKRLGTGIGWRPEIADDIASLPGIDWVEVVAENICPGHLPDALRALRERGTTIVPHGVSLGLGGAERPDPGRLTALAERAEALGAPLVSEHIAFVRGGGPLTASPGIEAGHLLPVPRTREALDVLCDNVRIAQDALPVPLALENIAALISWPGEELTEGQFLTELVERTGVRLLIDVANVHTNYVNRGEEAATVLAALPVEAIAYVHVAGGVERDGVWHDSHAHPVTRPVLDVLAELCDRVTPPGVLLERDEAFPPMAELARELDAIRAVMTRSTRPSAWSQVPKVPGMPGVSGVPGMPALPGVPQLSAAFEASGAAGPTAVPAAVPATGPAAVPTAGPAAVSTAVPAPRSSEPSPELVRLAVAAAHGARGTVAAAHPARGAVGTAPLEAAPGPVATARQASPSGSAVPSPVPGNPDSSDPLRQRLALAQTALLSALVAGTPAPEGFDRRRLRVQSRALAAKRADVVAKVAPELVEILGEAYRPAFLAYARTSPITGGYRRDALAFVERLLAAGAPGDATVRRRLAAWWQERSGPAPLPHHRATRLLRAARLVWGRR